MIPKPAFSINAIKQALQADIEIASKGRDEIARLCGNKNYQWTMRIPANERDSDLVLLAPIERLESRARALEVAVGAISDWIDDWEGEDPSLTRDNIYYANNLLSKIARLLGVGE